MCLRCMKDIYINIYGDGEIWLLLETKSHSAAKKAKGTTNGMLLCPFRL